jgi:hypothetical protein
METHAQDLVYRLLQLMPSPHLCASLQCLLALFLLTQRPRASDAATKSEAALSRFLNHYGWPTRKALQAIRRHSQRLIDSYLKSHRGRLPIVYAVVDLTCLEKTGNYSDLQDFVRTYNGKRGVHVALLYLCLGPWRFPWSVRVYRGKDTPTPTQLAIKLLRQIPKAWRERFKIRVLADAGFSTTELIPQAQLLGFEVIMSVRCDRTLQDGRSVQQVNQRGERVQLKDLDVPVTLSWFWRQHEDTGAREQHFVVATEFLSGAYLIRLGKLRWKIEACFKTLKHRFGWDCFGSGTRLGMYRWWLLVLISYLLAHWQFLASEHTPLDWQAAAQQAWQQLFPQEVVACFLKELAQLRPLMAAMGWSIDVSRIPVSG